MGRVAGVLMLLGVFVVKMHGQVLQTQPEGKVMPAPVVPPGSVSGHVICSDTNGPARFASVTLTPVIAPKSGTRRDKADSTGPRQISRIVHTGLDGSFTMSGVAPGNYYVLADQAGYQAASGQLTRDQMDKPTEATSKIMAQLLTPVSVAANHGSTVEVRLLRGASISGRVRYDDGTNDGGAAVKLWRKGEDGKWTEFFGHPLLNYFGVATDDLGQYRFAGLPSGEYRVARELTIQRIWTDSLFGSSRSWSSDGDYSMAVYYGGALREKDAKTVTLKSGEDADGVEIEIPVSKLHSIDGSLAEQGSGRHVNAGKVALTFADDGKELVSAKVEDDDEAFHFAFVPEGQYVVKVTGAADVTREQISNGPDSMPPFHVDTKTVRTFGEAKQPLVVTSDVTGLVVSVPGQEAAAKAAQ